MSMNVFDVPLHGKNISLRDFSSKVESRGDSAGTDAAQRAANVLRPGSTANGILCAAAMKSRTACSARPPTGTQLQATCTSSSPRT